MSLQNQIMAGGIAAEASKAIVGSVTTGLTATGSTQATALALAAANNAIATAAASTGVILPSGFTGDSIFVYNGGANTVNVYPPVGGTINNLAANTAVTIATTKSGTFVCGAANTWYSNLSA